MNLHVYVSVECGVDKLETHKAQLENVACLFVPLGGRQVHRQR